MATVVSDESSGDEYSGTQSSGSREMSSRDCTRMAGVLANYIISAEVKKVPVKRSELVKLLSKEHQKHISKLLEEAKSMLKDVRIFLFLSKK